MAEVYLLAAVMAAVMQNFNRKEYQNELCKREHNDSKDSGDGDSALRTGRLEAPLTVAE